LRDNLAVVAVLRANERYPLFPAVILLLQIEQRAARRSLFAASNFVKGAWTVLGNAEAARCPSVLRTERDGDHHS
jgi:hypothetical protein